MNGLLHSATLTPGRGIRNVLAFALLVGLPLSAAACLWDRDTPAEEAMGLPEVVAVLTGRFERNPPLYYEMRLARVTLHLQSEPDDLAAYDDCPVRLPRHRTCGAAYGG